MTSPTSLRCGLRSSWRSKLTQRQDARDAKERVKELDFGEVAVGLTKTTEGAWAIAVRAQRELTAAERERILNAAGEINVDFEVIAAFLRRGEYIYKVAKSAKSYLLEELDALHQAIETRRKRGKEQLSDSDFEGFLASLHEARDWTNDQLDHLIEITEEAIG